MILLNGRLVRHMTLTRRRQPRSFRQAALHDRVAHPSASRLRAAMRPVTSGRVRTFSASFPTQRTVSLRCGKKISKTSLETARGHTSSFRSYPSALTSILTTSARLEIHPRSRERSASGFKSVLRAAGRARAVPGTLSCPEPEKSTW